MADDLGKDWWKEEEESEGQDESISEEDRQKEPKETEKRPRDKEKKKKRKRKKKTITEELKETGEIAATADDVIAFLKKQFDGKLSPVERDEISLDTSEHFFDSNSTGGYPVAYLKGILHKWKKLKSQPLSEGSPLLLVISPSALRAVQLNRQIQDFKGENCRSAKLFAKHMKLEEQQRFLKKSVCHIGVGTPNRINSLIKSGHLKLDKLVAVIIDWNWRDVKSHRLTDIPEVRSELATLLQNAVIPHIKSKDSPCKIGIL